MEAAGMRSFATEEDLSDETKRTVRYTNLQEAQALVRELMVVLVRQYIETDKQRLRAKEVEAELKQKESILKAIVANAPPAHTAEPDPVDATNPEAEDTSDDTDFERTRSYTVKSA